MLLNEPQLLPVQMGFGHNRPTASNNFAGKLPPSDIFGPSTSARALGPEGAMYPWPLVGRVKRCWDRLKTWLKNNFPEAEATPGKGATEVEIEELEEVLEVKLPTPTRILYRFCDGQEFDKAKRNTLGIIGGYYFDYMVNVYLLPIREMHYTRELVDQSVIPSSKYAVVAASSKIFGMFFFLDCTNGQLYVGTRNLPIDGEMLPCVPNGLIRSVQQFGPDNQQDGMLLWLEEHCRRLEDGIIKLRGEGQYKSIWLFPDRFASRKKAISQLSKLKASSTK